MQPDRFSLSSFFAAQADAIAKFAVECREGQGSFDRAVEAIASCRSKVLVSGVGKSGLIAQKIAATLQSTGIVAQFLNPVDALHGDLGILREGDVVLLFSNSGESNEILMLIPHLRRVRVTIVGIVGRAPNPLADASDIVIMSSTGREVAPFGLPSTSSTTAMMLGDAIAAAAMLQRNVSAADIAAHHPAGALGRRLHLRVRDIMIPRDRCVSVEMHTSVSDLITRLAEGGIGTVWVSSASDSFTLLGIVTDGDLRRALRGRATTEWELLTVADVATREPIVTTSNTSAIDALMTMERNRRKPVTVLPVVDDGMVVGMLRMHDLVQWGLQP